MQTSETYNHHLATIGDAALLIWWGIVIIIDPITIGMGAIVSGLILLGVNAARLLKGIPTRESTTTLGVVALAWGMLAAIFDPSTGVSFAMLLIVIGMVMIASLWGAEEGEMVEG